MLCSYHCFCKSKRLYRKPGRHSIEFWELQKISPVYIFGQEICGNLPPAPSQYPAGSAERRICLEGTRKDSTASGANSRSTAAHVRLFCRTPYFLLLIA
jgi:hypothetical protein